MENNLTMQELLDQQEQELDNIKLGDEITGKVIKVSNDELILQLELGFNGSVPASELDIERGKNLEDVYSVGDSVTGIIMNVSRKNAIVKISVLKLKQKKDYEEIQKIFDAKETIVVHVERALERGLQVKYKSYSMFMPISQIDTRFVSNTADYLGQDLESYIKEINPRKNRIIVSHRDVAQEKLDIERKERREKVKVEREEQKAKRKAERDARKEKQKVEREALFASLEVGQKRTGKVTNIMPYGAFIDLGGAEGLAHINNLAWTRVEKVEDVVSEGQEVEVFVMDFDEEANRIALAVKDMDKDPWKLIASEVSVGTKLEVEILRVIDKGAFVKVKDGVEAYLPIGELSDKRVEKVEDVVNVGEKVNVAVIKFNPTNRRMMVSIKDLNKEPEVDYSGFMTSQDDSFGSIGDIIKKKND